MKTIFLFMMLIFVATLMGFLLYALWRLISSEMDDDYGRSTPTPWKAEFNPTNGKFYISRNIGKKTFYVANRFGLRKTYKEQLDAELVVDLLNK